MEQTCQKNPFRLRDRSNSPCSWLYGVDVEESHDVRSRLGRFSACEYVRRPFLSKKIRTIWNKIDHRRSVHKNETGVRDALRHLLSLIWLK
jgi:hypothetical protein